MNAQSIQFLVTARASEPVQNRRIICRITMKMVPSTEKSELSTCNREKTLVGLKMNNYYITKQ